MSEYRTHLREAVEALRDAATKMAEVLDEGAGLGVGAPNRDVVGKTSRDTSPAPPPAPREWWVNLYDGEPPGMVHPTRRSADESADPARTECVRVREVLANATAAYWREQLEREQQLHAITASERTEWEQHCRTAERERDDARAQLAEYRRPRTEEEVEAMAVALATAWFSSQYEGAVLQHCIANRHRPYWQREARAALAHLNVGQGEPTGVGR